MRIKEDQASSQSTCEDAERVSPERLSDRRLQVHHGSGDLQRGVALVLDTVHVLDRVSRKSVDQDTGGVGFGHALHLEGKGKE